MQFSTFPKSQLSNGRTIRNPRRDIKMGNDRRLLRRYKRHAVASMTGGHAT
jgi:hypothetical protein